MFSVQPHGLGRPFDPGLMGLLGSPHAVIILMAGLLLVLERIGRREKDASREKWLVWAFAAVLARETLMLGTRVFHLLSGPPPAHPVGPGPIFGVWSEHVVALVLVAAFLRFLTAKEQPARAYLIGGATVLTALAAAILIAGAPPAADIARQFRHPPLAPAVMNFVGLATMIAALALTYRNVPASARLVAYCGVGAFVFRDLVGFGVTLSAPVRGAPPGHPILGAATIVGLMLFGYLFIQQRAVAAHTDLELLEGLVKERTSELESALEQLSEANVLLVEQSSVDSLTGVRNRRSFDEKLFVEWARAVRSGAPVGVALVDIDNFKAINDRFGHPAGDECLIRVAAALQAGARRPGDVVARHGGDEFAVLLPGADRANVVRLLDGIRGEIANLRGGSGSPDLAFTVSVGAASARPGEGGSVEELIRLADEELYRAKQGGKNRVGAVGVEV